MSSWDLKTRLESQFARMNCQMFSCGLSSDERAGGGMSEMLVGTLSALVGRLSDRCAAFAWLDNRCAAPRDWPNSALPSRRHACQKNSQWARIIPWSSSFHRRYWPIDIKQDVELVALGGVRSDRHGP